ncbi:unnamed protein product [Mycena citricolor]|uniref:Glutathione hydrolase n=1 Tax=Mycena citricolor TaxID=2018698 RepID=A0AAD2H5B7_9AGAR|nr:unnamed protein product [Mycena citricolor]
MFDRKLGPTRDSDSDALPVYSTKTQPDEQPPRVRRLTIARLLRSITLLVLLLVGYAYIRDAFETKADVSFEKRLGDSGNPAYLVKARHGAVATENVLCSDIGVGVLKAGGNAVDAAVAATFCIGTVNMFSSGVGGGGFMTVRIPPVQEGGESEVFTVDFRETAPALANTTMFPPYSNSSLFGGLSVAVPGEVRGLAAAHDRWGTLPWHSLIEPSIELAKGWTVQAELAKRITWFPDVMLSNPDWSAIFAPNGRFLEEGETIRRTNYSQTLAAIAAEGPDALYNGRIADSIVEKIQSTGGVLTHADLEGFSVKIDRALQGTYRGRKVYTTPTPSSGVVLLHMLNLIEQYDLSERSPLNAHRIVEAIKFGFAARTKVCDPSYINDTAKMDRIPTKEFAALIGPNITDNYTHSPDYYNPEYDVKIDNGTSHTVVVDKDGMAVSLTSTVNLIFGSQVMDPVTGILLNDEMDDFSTPKTPNGFGLWPSPYNYPEPGKKPLSSTVPTIIENADGSLALVIGGSGGGRIFGAVFQIILNVLEWDLDASAAVEFGRLHNQLFPVMTDADAWYPRELLDGLKERGHELSETGPVAAAVQLIALRDGYIFAASDSRKNGIASGF